MTVPPEKVLEVVLESLNEGVEDAEVAELPGHPAGVLDQEELEEDQLQALDHLHNSVSIALVIKASIKLELEETKL